MAKRDKAAAGTVAWVDLQTPDLEKARAFYGELLGWSFTGGDNPELMHYTMAQLGEHQVAGMAQSAGSSPTAWNVYFASDDVDASVERVKAAGGELLMGPEDVLDSGRMAFFRDPTGAPFAVWQAKKHAGAGVVGEPGAMAWHELYTRGAQRACAFYGDVFGLEAKRLDATAIEYWSLHKGEDTVGGTLQMGAQMPKEVPPRWNTYFAVANADASAKRLMALGGVVLQPPFDTPYGRMSSVVDPFGAPFCLIQLPKKSS